MEAARLEPYNFYRDSFTQDYKWKSEPQWNTIATDADYQVDVAIQSIRLKVGEIFHFGSASSV